MGLSSFFKNLFGGGSKPKGERPPQLTGFPVAKTLEQQIMQGLQRPDISDRPFALAEEAGMARSRLEESDALRRVGSEASKRGIGRSSLALSRGVAPVVSKGAVERASLASQLALARENARLSERGRVQNLAQSFGAQQAGQANIRSAQETSRLDARTGRQIQGAQFAGRVGLSTLLGIGSNLDFGRGGGQGAGTFDVGSILGSQNPPGVDAILSTMPPDVNVSEVLQEIARQKNRDLFGRF